MLQRNLLVISGMMTHARNCECDYCKNQKPFDMPKHLAEKLASGELVVFAGAGISTENKTNAKNTFYEEIHAELDLKDATPTFPELMSQFCAQPDGRIKLIERIKQRFDNFSSFDQFYNRMTQFHRALAPLFMITDVVTTNWDDFFERECGFTPFVYDSDLAFWDASPRRAMKIHGSITNFGSIVATNEDYRLSYERLNDGPLGAHLKSLIARKTVAYVGYSLSDENYLRLLGNIARMMGDKTRQSYFISPQIDPARIQAAPVPLIPIETDGAFFFEEVRRKNGDALGITTEAAFYCCLELLDEVATVHDKTATAFLKTNHPLLIFALSYQDGLSHALRRIIRMKKTGEYHSINSVHSRVHTYETMVEDYIKHENFWDAAYCLGYHNGLLYLLLASQNMKAPKPPFFEMPFDVTVGSLKEIAKRPQDKLPRKVAKFVRQMMRDFPRNAGVVPDHPPYL